MKKIDNCIVFSNDIKRILNGKNALDFNYSENKLIIPNNSFIENLRVDFKKDVNKIFNNNTLIITETDMIDSLNNSIIKVFGNYPHRYIR